MTIDFRVTLLGTGVPIPAPERFGPCTLVEAGDQKFLIDAGRGATIRLYQLKIPIGRIDVQLLTHYHSDHTSCLPDVWLTGWLESYFGARKSPYKVIGPTGAKRLMENLERAYADDIKIRIADEKLPDIFNTDQGSQFTGAAFTGVLAANGIAISMDGKGAWRDNVFVERLWRTVKYEEVYLKAYDSVSEARSSIGRYLDFYNGRRPHSSLDGTTPDHAYSTPLPLRLAA